MAGDRMNFHAILVWSLECGNQRFHYLVVLYEERPALPNSTMLPFSPKRRELEFMFLLLLGED